MWKTALPRGDRWPELDSLHVGAVKLLTRTVADKSLHFPHRMGKSSSLGGDFKRSKHQREEETDRSCPGRGPLEEGRGAD